MKKNILILTALLAPLFSSAQNILAWRSVSELNRPELTWYTLDKNLKPFFETYRAPVGTKEFVKIAAMERISSSGDTLFFHVMDTLLTAKGIYQYFVKAKDARDTAFFSEVMYGHNLGYLPSPQVISFTATSATGRKALELNWKLNYAFTVKALALFRSRNYDKGFELVAVLPADTNHYEDVVTASNEPYFYFLQIRDFFGYQLPSVVIHGICTYAEKSYPPQNFKAFTERESVTLSWKTVGSNVIGYRVYKSFAVPGSFLQAGPMIPVADSLARFTDTAVHAPGQLTARYYAVTLSDGYLESNHTDTLTVSLPWNIVVSPPREVDLVLDSARQVRLFWTAAGPNSGVAGYNVFRSLKGSPPLKINPALLPADENTFLDTDPGGYGTIQYSVESVSAAGKPSALRTTVTGERPLGGFHLVVSAERTDKGIELTWTDPGITGLETLYFYRKAGEGAAEMKGMVRPGNQSWVDTNITSGGSYMYTVVGEFKDGTRILVNDGILVEAR